MAALSKVNTNEAVPPIAVTSSVPLGQIRDRSGSNETFQSAQHFKDFAHIPPHRTTADEVLIWPIFDNAYPTNSFIQYYLGGSATSINHNGQAIDEEIEIVPYSSEVPPLDEHKIPHLVNSFLINVHTKNPILDVETLVRKSREYAVRGLGWDGYSCLLLLACALGMIAKPFGTEHAAIDLDMPIDQARQLASPVVDKCKADNCFISATRRLGGFRPSMSTAHCYFFAGVYLMYTLRPMYSWQYFYQASTVLQIYLKTSGKLTEDKVIVLREPGNRSPSSNRLSHLEQRLFWSTFKSEAEFRIELPLPQSEIADYDFSCLFPSPPSPTSPADMETCADSPLQTLSPATGLSVLVPDDASQIRQHSNRNEEESWYYYLTEIALRRIGNRVINTFFGYEKSEWLNIDRYLDMAIEYEAQVTTWQTNLPPAMQRYETASTIRAPRAASPGGAEAGYVSQELSWATENRLLEMRSWLYQPFLYYLVHIKPTPPPNMASFVTEVDLITDTEDDRERLFWSVVSRAISCNLTILDTRSIPHRHHGLWFDLRAITCSSLILLAMIKAGYMHLIPGGRSALIGEQSTALSQKEVAGASQTGSTVGGRFGRVLRQLEIWSHESGDMIRARQVLVSLIEDIIL